MSLLRCPEWLEREREREKERKRGVSNSSDRGTPQRKRNCLLHCQPMAIPASSPLNIIHKHNVHTIRHYSSIRPHRPIRVYVGITTVTTKLVTRTHNITVLLVEYKHGNVLMVWSLTLSVVLFRFCGLNVVAVGVLVCVCSAWHPDTLPTHSSLKKTYMHFRRYTS